MIKLKDTYEKIFETVWHNYTCGEEAVSNQNITYATLRVVHP